MSGVFILLDEQRLSLLPTAIALQITESEIQHDQQEPIAKERNKRNKKKKLEKDQVQKEWPPRYEAVTDAVDAAGRQRQNAKVKHAIQRQSRKLKPEDRIRKQNQNVYTSANRNVTQNVNQNVKPNIKSERTEE